jgi:hypothetical protein
MGRSVTLSSGFYKGTAETMAAAHFRVQEEASKSYEDSLARRVVDLVLFPHGDLFRSLPQRWFPQVKRVTIHGSTFGVTDTELAFLQWTRVPSMLEGQSAENVVLGKWPRDLVADITDHRNERAILRASKKKFREEAEATLRTYRTLDKLLRENPEFIAFCSTWWLDKLTAQQNHVVSYERINSLRARFGLPEVEKATAA